MYLLAVEVEGCGGRPGQVAPGEGEGGGEEVEVRDGRRLRQELRRRPHQELGRGGRKRRRCRRRSRRGSFCRGGRRTLSVLRSSLASLLLRSARLSSFVFTSCFVYMGSQLTFGQIDVILSL